MGEPGKPIVHPKDAGSDREIAKRLERDPTDEDAKLDQGSDESMDASDPPAASAPRSATVAPPSSGYDAEQERKRTQ